MTTHDQTIKTYDESAQALAAYFAGIGPRTEDIERALELAQATHGARVIEIGCGDGRDAAEIIKRVAWYQGFDPSRGLLELAQAKLPEASFVAADALTYDYPQGLDVVFAFASLLHVNKADLANVCAKIAKALRPGGILYVSLKERPEYEQENKKDEFGERMFYFYSPRVVEVAAGDAFVVAYEGHQHIGKTAWFTLALRRV